jgi:hypothetical protein
LAVEAKSRHRPGVIAHPGYRRLRKGLTMEFRACLRTR